MCERLAAGESQSPHAGITQAWNHEIPEFVDAQVIALAYRGYEAMSTVQVAALCDLHERLAAVA